MGGRGGRCELLVASEATIVKFNKHMFEAYQQYRTMNITVSAISNQYNEPTVGHLMYKVYDDQT